MTPHPFQIPEKTVLALAVGGGGTEAIDILRRVQYSKRRLLLGAIPVLASRAGHPQAAAARRAFTALTEIEADAAGALETVVLHPAVGAWAQQTAVSLHSGAEAEPRDLAGVAAAVAVRAGLDCEFEVPVHDGGVMLPSLGRALLPGSDGAAAAVVRQRAGNAEVVSGRERVRLPEDRHRDAPGWQAVRHIDVGPGVRFLFDDVDPYRMPIPDLAEQRAGEAELGEWRELLGRAWVLLARHHQTTAEEIAGLITTLVPMTAASADVPVSTTSMQAIGGIALSTPRDVRYLAETLAHETQHSKLGALLDAVPLTMPDDGRRYYAPWRDDPRPASGLLQGAYAFFGVAAFWRVQRGHEQGDLALHAHTEFARRRDGVELAVRTLEGSGALTPEGRLFAGAMAATLEAWRHDPVPAEAAVRARRLADAHLVRWRLTNGEPPAEQPAG